MEKNSILSYCRWLAFCFFACCCLAVWGQENEARDVMRRTVDAFRRAGGIRATFLVHSSEGNTSGTIQLKGEKFVLEAGGMTTWFDGRTQWTYLSSSDEVNISEPTPAELQTLNPYAWLSLYDQGYALQLLAGGTSNVYQVQMTATSSETPIEKLLVWIKKDTLLPSRVSLTLAGSFEPTVITIRDCRVKQDYADSFFTFDRRAYPTAEIIDLR